MKICNGSNNLLGGFFRWLLLSLGISFFVHIIFSFEAPCACLVAKWSAGDALTFLSSTAAVVATVALGRTANDLSKTALDLQRRGEERLDAQILQDEKLRKIDSQRPFLIIVDVMYDDGSKASLSNGTYLLGKPEMDEQPKGVWLVLRNYGDGVANHVMLEKRTHGAFGNPGKNDVELICIPSDGEQKLYFPYRLYSQSDSFRVYYENLLGAVYSQTFSYGVSEFPILEESTGEAEGFWRQGAIYQLSSQLELGLNDGYNEMTGTYDCDLS